MERIVKSGLGWRLGWNPQGMPYQGLVGTEDWAIELTGVEFDDFCRLLMQLAQTMSEMASELVDEEKITCEAESDSIWMEVEGYPSTYTLRLILNQGRRCEGSWLANAVPGLVQGAQSLKVF
ncbi:MULTISPECIES: DUF1818 family protein [unclassified Coleofasciculus]|uniref:DUF1818 family protein n=1 Tax=unclassified Coleofasciculus TaxID=2692782 RepID=UPI00187F4265|nr:MULTISPECIES: DUF1818 family protein [unclassified Coleofasciculus]MBE9127251.1 DUF1818 family protein [Coleofasciculus sp. LEGE 07081]MBE9150597.1 DUF1818 family protein [Coleofasciculus sp. LEGE 07092]